MIKVVVASSATPFRMPEPRSMDYSSFVGMTRERNRPSGGIRTVQESAVQARIGPGTRVLEIGSNTGFTSVNIGLLTGASVVGIDVNRLSVQEATEYAETHDLGDQVQFQLQDARELAFEDGSFDVVWVSNVVSFVAEKEQMLREVTRVLKRGGTVIAVPIYYRDQPPRELVDRVSQAIGTKIEVMTKLDWTEFYASVEGLEIYYESDYVYDLIDEGGVQSYCDRQMQKEHLVSLDHRSKEQVRDQMSYFMNLFNENLSYAGFSIILLQKRIERDEEELFVSRPAPSRG